jgi:hypothetical protein
MCRGPHSGGATRLGFKSGAYRLCRALLFAAERAKSDLARAKNKREKGRPK